MRLRGLNMVQAVGILSVLQILTEAPGALGEGAPYGVSRQVVEGAARAGAALSADGRPRSRQLEDGSVPPALSQLATPEIDIISNTTEAATQTTPEFGDGKQQDDSLLEDLEVAIVVTEPPTSSMPQCELGRGTSGEVRYEKILDSKLEQGATTADVIRRNDMPETVLSLCRNRCVNDKTAEQQFRRTCTAFDFIPGKRITRYSNSIEYTESKCLLSQTENQREDPRYLKEKDHLHYREVCYSAVRVKQQCPNRLSVMERIRNYEFQPKDAKLVPSNSREDCQDKCLNQLTDDPINSTNVCRSGTWDKVQRRCYLSSFTRRTHPHELKQNANFDYFENTCLSNELRCPKNKLVFVKQNNKELGGTYDTAIYQDLNLTQCQDKCLGSPTLFCRSLEYDEQSKTCVLSEEDTTSKRDELRDSTSQKSVYYELMCIDGAKIHGDYQFVRTDNEEKQQLNDRQYRDVRTAFQLFRNRRLELRSGFTGSRGRDRDRLTLAECLDECLEERSFICRSVMYSDRYQTCKLSEYDQLNGDTVYDGEYDYYENLIENQMIHQATSGSEENVISVPGEDGNRDIGPGSAGQTGVFRPPPPSFDRNANVNRNGNGNGGFLASSGFENNGQRVSSDRFNSIGGKTSTVTDSNLGSNGNERSGSAGFLASTGFDRNRPSSSGSSSFNRDSNRDSSRLGDNRFRPLGGSGSSSFNDIDSNRLSSGSLSGSSNRPDRLPINFGGNRPSTASQTSGSGLATKVGDDLQVTQQCTDDGMEFILTTNDVFRGRIYTYGYYDRCYVRGSGGTVTNLRISGERGRPECGTIKYGDTSSNIVVVQFSDNVQTSLDKRYNLTCTITGPGEAVVTSGYIGASNGAPTPIEYLPAENQLQSRVRLQILYGGRPTTTIAVGDPLTFRLEAQSGRQTISDIFATNVVAKDPYTGREVKLIDNRGCPIDNHVFPGLGQARDGDGLEARFNAFKIPESNFLIFEATVRSCRRGCEPAFCTSNNGREELPSYGRKRRAATDDPLDDGEEDEEAEIHGIYEVYLNREEIPEQASIELKDELCLAPSEYYGLVATIAILIVFLLAALLAIAYCSRRSHHQDLTEKNSLADAGNPFAGQSSSSASQFPGAHPRTLTEPASYFPNNEDATPAQCDRGGQGIKGRFQDPSEPIFTNPALFER